MAPFPDCTGCFHRIVLQQPAQIGFLDVSAANVLKQVGLLLWSILEQGDFECGA